MNMNPDIINEAPRNTESPPSKRVPRPQYKVIQHIKYQKRLKDKIAKQMRLPRKPD